jgi:hypothetical protein
MSVIVLCGSTVQTWMAPDLTFGRGGAAGLPLAHRGSVAVWIELPQGEAGAGACQILLATHRVHLIILPRAQMRCDDEAGNTRRAPGAG